MLHKVNEVIEKNSNPDLIKFDYCEIIDGEKTIAADGSAPPPLQTPTTGQDLFAHFINNKINYELSCLYAYNKNFWLTNNLNFAVRKSS